MKNKFTYEIVVALALIVLAVLLLNPLHFWMPDMMVMAMLALVVALFALFAVFVVHEKVQDEREMQHRALSGRIAFLAGSAVLTLGIVIQGFTHSVDVWLVLALIAMIFTKFATRFYSEHKL